MQATIREAVERVLKEIGAPEARFSVEHPADLAHGDYATNAALVAAKVLGKSPREVAEALVAALTGAPIPGVAKLEIAGPGFINVHLERAFFVREIESANKAGETWGHNEEGKQKLILLEYTSPNLFKPLHVGNLVGNIIGESLSRLLVATGAEVKHLNYPSDIGLTVAKGVWGLRETKGDPDDIMALGEAYRYGNEAYETNEKAKADIEAVNRALYADRDPELSELRQRGVATSQRHLDELCRMLGTTFDTVIFESEAGPLGQSIVKEHVADGIFEESDGAIVFKGEKVGLHTRVFLNSQGLPTYEAKDVGNFTLKQRAYPNWDMAMIVTGNEQREYFKVVFAALREIYPEAVTKVFEHVPTGFLTLTTGKMSSRKGNVLTGESLIAEIRERAKERAAETRAKDVDSLTEMVAVAALKYQILRQAVGTNIVFDKEQALSFEGDSGPYLQYTAARAASVTRKAEQGGVAAATINVPELVYDVERLLYQFPEVVARAGEERAPHHVAQFLTQLAGAFNAFYANERIVDDEHGYAPYKVALTRAVHQTLKNGLWLLGIRTPEEM